MTFEYPMLCFHRLKINSSVSTWLQRQDAPCSLQIFYTPTNLQFQHKPFHGWRAEALVPFGHWHSSPPPVCPPLCWCWEWRWSISCAFLSTAAVNVAAPSANNSGQERALCTSCARGEAWGLSALQPQPASQGDSEEAAFNRPESCLRSLKELLEKSCSALLTTTTSAKHRCQGWN